jgi:hypothetical protein
MTVTVENGFAVVYKGLYSSGDGQLLVASGKIAEIAYDYGGRCDDIAMPAPPEDGLWAWEGEVVDGLPGNEDWQYQGSYRRAGPADLGRFWLDAAQAARKTGR